MDVDTHISRKQKLNAWIGAMRLRTLPLAMASTLTGAFLATINTNLDAGVLVFTLITTILLQINSNLANDYGDFSHGTDNDSRIGPQRAMQGGSISAKEMRMAIAICSILAFFSGMTLIYLAQMGLWAKGFLFVFGVAAIYASIKYTAGANPYGYRGLGDVSVMAFFGVLGVIGAYVCQTGTIGAALFLPALAIGAFSTAVLNINNTRDIASDTAAQKITIAVRLGPERARIYHVLLIASGCVLFLLFAIWQIPFGTGWLFLLSYPLFILNAWRVYSTRNAAGLDPYLKQLALSTFLLALLLGLGLWLA